MFWKARGTPGGNALPSHFCAPNLLTACARTAWKILPNLQSAAVTYGVGKENGKNVSNSDKWQKTIRHCMKRDASHFSMNSQQIFGQACYMGVQDLPIVWCKDQTDFIIIIISGISLTLHRGKHYIYHTVTPVIVWTNFLIIWDVKCLSQLITALMARQLAFWLSKYHPLNSNTEQKLTADQHVYTSFYIINIFLDHNMHVF